MYGEQFTRSLFRALDENGYASVVLAIQDHLHNSVKEESDDGFLVEHFPFVNDESPDDEMGQVLWSALADSFGDWGVSMRTGWIREWGDWATVSEWESLEKAQSFIDALVIESGIDFEWQDGWPNYVRTGEPVKEDEEGNFIHEYPAPGVDWK